VTGAVTIPPWRAAAGAVVVRVRLQPRSSRDEIDGVGQRGGEAVLKARVRALPEDGAANEALLRLLADWIGVPKTALSLASGGKSRDKSIAIAGDVGDIERRLAARLSEIETSKST
jgi:hypothetical protein